MPFIYSYTFENKKLQKKASTNIPLHHTLSPKLTLYFLLCQKLFFKIVFYFQPFHACSILSLYVWLFGFIFINWWKLRLHHHCSAFPQYTPNFCSFLLYLSSWWLTQILVTCLHFSLKNDYRNMDSKADFLQLLDSNNSYRVISLKSHIQNFNHLFSVCREGYCET